MRRISRLGIFLGLFAVSLAFWWGPLTATARQAFNNDEYTHILIILPISLGLIFLQRRVLSGVPPRFSLIFPGALFVLALAIFAFVRFAGAAATDYRLTLLMTGLIFWWLGAFIISFGWEGFKESLFPLCFLFWMVPWPGPFLDKVVSLLQIYSASLTRLFFQIFNIPVMQQGVRLFIPGLSIEVAVECSSIRSSIILVITGMLLAYLSLRSNWKRTLVVLVALPLSVFKNGVRIFTLSMLGLHVNPGFLTGRLHHQGGIVFFAVALVILWLFVRLLERSEKPSPLKPVALSAVESPR